MKYILPLLTLFILSSCAHHKDVRPGGADGENTVLIKSQSQEDGMRNAIAQANSYCKQFNKIPRITSEGKKYEGDLNEDVYKQGKKLKDAASIFLGGSTGGYQAKKAADTYLGNPYATQVKFVCE